MDKSVYGIGNKWPEHPVDEIGLSTRTRCCLKNEDLHTLGDVYDYGASALLRMPNFGRKSLNELNEIFAVVFGRHIPLDARHLAGHILKSNATPGCRIAQTEAAPATEEFDYAERETRQIALAHAVARSAGVPCQAVVDEARMFFEFLTGK